MGGADSGTSWKSSMVLALYELSSRQGELWARAASGGLVKSLATNQSFVNSTVARDGVCQAHSAVELLQLVRVWCLLVAHGGWRAGSALWRAQCCAQGYVVAVSAEVNSGPIDALNIKHVSILYC